MRTPNYNSVAYKLRNEVKARKKLNTNELLQEFMGEAEHLDEKAQRLYAQQKLALVQKSQKKPLEALTKTLDAIEKGLTEVKDAQIIFSVASQKVEIHETNRAKIQELEESHGFGKGLGKAKRVIYAFFGHKAAKDVSSFKKNELMLEKQRSEATKAKVALETAEQRFYKTTAALEKQLVTQKTALEEAMKQTLEQIARASGHTDRVTSRLTKDNTVEQLQGRGFTPITTTQARGTGPSEKTI